jgi:oligoribonuclease NrnB/cAMP/cGMP phosphodiesterase (DHH superfamily)
VNICYYHRADLDGICSAAIVKKFDPDVQLIGVDYGDKHTPLPHAICERVYMVDFSLQPIERMVALVDLVGRDRFVWIDHHKSAIEEAKRVGLDMLRGIREVGLAGCELTWQYFAGGPIPIAVKLLGRYDVWDLNYSVNVLPFQYAMRMEAETPTSSIWEPLLNGGAITRELRQMLEQGLAILRYVKADDKKYLAACGFSTTLDDLTAIALNRLAGSQAFEGNYDPTTHDLMIAFVRQNRRWKVSLFSTKPEVDCSALAKKYGGGGHKGAAGFVCDELPFEV